MAKELGKIERKNGNGSFGSFLFGTFIGVLLGIGAIAGIVAFAYFKVSANWINDKFNTELTLGNEDLNNLTLSEAVNHAVGLVQNMDSYTFNNLKDDFGIDIGDEIIGISITDLKDVPIPELMDAVQNKFANISAYELRKVLDLSDMETILSQKNTYYFNEEDNKLYNEDTHDTKVEFEYTYDAENSLIKVKDTQDDISPSNEVEFELQYLPLTIALADFVNDLGENTTIRELTGYGITLPNFLNKEKYLDRKLSELQNIIDDMYVAEILNYNYSGSGDVTNGDGVVQTGVIAAVAKIKVKNLATDINNLTVADLFGTSSEGVLSLIEGTTTLNNIPSAINNVLTTKTIDELITAKVVEAPSNYYGTDGIKDKYITIDVGTTDSPEIINKQVSQLLLEDIVKISFTLFDKVDGLLQDGNSIPIV